MFRPFLALSVAATLLAPMAAFAQAPAPAANRVNGSITATDGKTITVTPRARRGGAAGATPAAPAATAPVVVTIGSAKIYKAADAAGSPTGSATDLIVGANVQVTTDGATPPTATEIHLRAPRGARPGGAPATPPAAPAAPATPAAGA